MRDRDHRLKYYLSMIMFVVRLASGRRLANAEEYVAMSIP
jgi:hypothetical protein